MKKPLLVGSAGCGSVIAEFGFNLAGIAYDYEEVDYGEGSACPRSCFPAAKPS